MFRPMRRGRQQLPEAECIEILQHEPRGVLSVLGDEGYPYGVPMDFWYCPADGKLYFHCARQGHKLDAITGCDKVSFCVCDRGYREEGQWALNFRSVIVFGRIRQVEPDEKILQALAGKFTSDAAYTASEIRKHIPHVALLALTPEHITGKRVQES